MFSLKQRLQVKIEKLIFGGAGLARIDGAVVFVDFAAPDDLLEVEITEIKKNFLKADIVSILEPGPTRIQPICSVAGKCGGCSWQQVEYTEQLKQKQRILEEAFLKAFKKIDFKLHNILPSPEQFHYRNRIQLKFKNGKLGYYAKKSHDIIAIDHCPLAESPLNEKIKTLPQDLQQKKIQESDRIELLIDESEQVKAIFDRESDDNIGFSQVNRSQNVKMIEKVLEWSDGSFDQVLDLYAGAGNFTFPLFQKFPKAKVQAVELSHFAVQVGQQKAQKAQISHKNLAFFVGDVGSYIKRLPKLSKSLVILDPPRVGCDQSVMNGLSSLGAEKIIYISCNPTSFIRDIERLKNYKIVQVQPFDMFPQTDHIELVAQLVIDSK